MFPLIFKRTPLTQVFDKYSGTTFRGLPPMLADSLPDAFGNIIFRKWMKNTGITPAGITVLEQLAYAGKRGMGVLEYVPRKEIPAATTIDIDGLVRVVKQMLDHKSDTSAEALNHASLLNIFRIGTSAGGVGPKILVSEHKTTGKLIPGDLEVSADYNHYLVKLGIDDTTPYRREAVEYVYYLAATAAGIYMVPSRLIDKRHFATERFDRHNGGKKHVLTATGLTGWDHTHPETSSYENLFDLARHLKVPHKDITQLFRRMVFNLVFANHDDHMKNHSFIYNQHSDTWGIAPAFDLTYSLNPLLTVTRHSRALSLGGKRTEINRKDLLTIAARYTVKNPNGIIEDINAAAATWEALAADNHVPKEIIGRISLGLNVMR